jgi:hypothetical protein
VFPREGTLATERRDHGCAEFLSQREKLLLGAAAHYSPTGEHDRP